MATQLVQARVDGELVEEAATILAAMGLTVPDAVRLLLARVARDKALPFASLLSNDETIADELTTRVNSLTRRALPRQP